MNRKSLAILVYGVLALLLLSELWFSNVASFAIIAETAEARGLSISAERMRLYISIVLDAIGGGGAIIVILGLLAKSVNLTKRAIAISFAGTLLYGGYQFFLAMFQLAPHWRGATIIVGVIYILFGLLARFLGNIAIEQGL